MGIQVYFNKVDALKAGAVFKTYYDTEEERFVEEYTIPGIKDSCFNNYWVDSDNYVTDRVCTDFNSWGSNKGLLKPWLDKNNIAYYEA